MKKYEDFDEVKLVKGNIPIDKSLFNKYKNVEEIFSSCKKNYSKYDSGIVLPDMIIDIANINLSLLSKGDIRKLAVNIFNKYHTNNIFINNGYSIIVSNGDIKESAYKIVGFTNQRIYLHEHLIIFANLGNIIKQSILINQTLEYKERSSNVLWSYYIIYLKIQRKKFLLLFDVISKANGENHLRIQRLELIV